MSPRKRGNRARGRAAVQIMEDTIQVRMTPSSTQNYIQNDLPIFGRRPYKVVWARLECSFNIPVNAQL